jgi:S1-C subfamily serine protease
MGVPEGAAGDGIRDPLGIPRYLRIASRFFRGCDGAPILTAGGAVFGMVRGGDAHAEALTWVERMDDVLLVARQIIEAGDNFERPQIGLHLDPSSGGDRTWRPVIAAVEEQSPAAAAGLRAGDVVRSINGSAVGTPSLAWREMCKLRADEPVVLHVERDGDDVEAVLTPKAVERGWL